jgi:hypothetical protein
MYATSWCLHGCTQHDRHMLMTPATGAGAFAAAGGNDDHGATAVAAAAGKSGTGGAVSGMETEAEGEGDATDVEGIAAAAAAAGEEGDEDLPAELNALLTAVSTDQSQLPDMFEDEQLWGECAVKQSVCHRLCDRWYHKLCH